MAGGLESEMQSWTAQGLGIVAITLLIGGQAGSPTINDAQVWKSNFGINSAYVAPDAGFQMVPGQSVGTPQLTIVNPRTMQVVLLQEGWGGSYPPQLMQTAQANQ